jgi:response regulator RpfG family c-di-GMP phosphodiesterase
MLLAHVACAMSASMSWNSSATYEKLTMAALMHDVTMKSQTIAELDSIAELEARKSEFTEEDQKAFRAHPIESSMLVRTMNKIPADVDAIIAQHHEKAAGGGFPRGVTHTHIGHLSCLFIIAHDMTRFLLDKDEVAKKQTRLEMGDFLEARRGDYGKGNFRKIFEVLEREFAPA